MYGISIYQGMILYNEIFIIFTYSQNRPFKHIILVFLYIFNSLFVCSSVVYNPAVYKYINTRLTLCIYNTIAILHQARIMHYDYGPREITGTNMKLHKIKYKPHSIYT